MKRLLLITATIFIIQISDAQQIPSDSLYLGQTPPGSAPEIFKLPVDLGLMASDRIAITNDGKKIYYREKDYSFPPSIEKIKYLSYDNNMWTGPFNLFEGMGTCALSVTGDTMFIGESFAKQYNKEYFSVKNDTGWGKPNLFSSKLSLAYYLQETNKGNYYFSSANALGGLGQRDWSKLIINGADTIIQSLGVPLCTSGDESDFCVSRDESFMIFARNGIEISFHKNDGSWTNPKSLGSKINFGIGSWGTYISPDNKFLFYTTGTKTDYSDTYVYWVRIDNLIDSLKHTNFVPWLKKAIKDTVATAGTLFTYSLPDSVFIDDDGNNTLTYSATLSNGTPLPSGLSFNPATKTFSGTPVTEETITVRITVTDTVRASIYDDFKIEIKKSTGIQVDKKKDKIVISPNPTNEHFTISFNDISYEKTIVDIYNTSGNLVFSETYHNVAKATIDLTGFPTGMYVVKVIADGINYEEKIIKK